MDDGFWIAKEDTLQTLDDHTYQKTIIGVCNSLFRSKCVEG